MTVQDFHDLLRLLEAHPQWRAELRRLLLTADLLALPDLVRELAAAQKRTEERLTALAARVDELAAAQKRTEEHLQELTTATKELVARAGKLTDDVGLLKGYVLERKYRERAPAYFGSVLRGIHALSMEEVARLVDGGVAGSKLSAEDRGEILETDLVIRGVRPADSSETYLAVEISAGIGRHDVARAHRRARILQRVLSKPVLPVVAGEWITTDAEEQAIGMHVWRVLNGRVQPPDGDGTEK